MSSFRALRNDLFAYGIMGGISRGVNLLLMPVLTRFFSPATYGAIDVIATMTALLTVLVSLNLESALARLWVERSEARAQSALVTSILTAISVVGIGLVAAVWALSGPLSLLLLHDAGSATFVALGGAAGALAALFTVPQIALRMQRRITLYNALSMSQAVIYIGLAVLLVGRFHLGLVGVFAAQVIAGAAALGLGLFAIREYLKVAPVMAEMSAALRYSVPLLPATAAVWVNSQTDRVVLLGFLGLAAVGVFGAASRLVMVMSLLAGGFQQAWTPLAIGMINAPDPISRNRFYARVLNYYIGGLLIIALAMTGIAKELLAVLAPPAYREGYVVVPWLAGAQVLQGSSCITNLGMLISKRTIGNSIAAWVGASLNVIVCLVLVPYLGIKGAAFGMFIASLAFTTLLWRFSVQTVGIRFDTRTVTLNVVCFVAASTVLLTLAEEVATWQLSLLLRTLVTAAACTTMAAYTWSASRGVAPATDHG